MKGQFSEVVSFCLYFDNETKIHGNLVWCVKTIQCQLTGTIDLIINK